MTDFWIVNPHTRTIKSVRCKSVRDAQGRAGLDGVDHGTLTPRLGYVVYEYGLFTPPAEQAYCGIAGRLIAGTAVLYAFDDAGETVDLRRAEVPKITWYSDLAEVEAAIERREIVRPFMAVDGVVTWQWPDPR